MIMTASFRKFTSTARKEQRKKSKGTGTRLKAQEDQEKRRRYKSFACDLGSALVPSP
jgi:hypothetical protein